MLYEVITAQQGAQPLAQLAPAVLQARLQRIDAGLLGRPDLDVLNGAGLVITSYSIHYTKLYEPLIVDTDAVLSAAAALQCFQSIGGWYPQVVQRPRVVQHAQFASRNMLDVLWQTL